MNLDDLFDGMWKGARFFVQAVSEAGGRKHNIKDIIDSDLRLIEDHGILPPSFVFHCILASTQDSNGNSLTDYADMRETLLRAIAAKGPGDLVHPWRGTLPNMFCTDYQFGESMAKLGQVSVTLTFKVTNTDGRPIPVEATVGDVHTGMTGVDDEASVEIGGIVVTPRFKANFNALVEKATEVGEAIDGAMATTNAIETRIDSWSAQLGTYAANVLELAAVPTDLAYSTLGLFLSARGLYQSARASFNAFTLLFPFGSSDSPIYPTTAGRVERLATNNAMNSSVRSMALASAYGAGAEIDFATVSEIDETVAVLEAQYQALSESTEVSGDLLATLTDLRTSANTYFDAQRLQAPRLVEVSTYTTSLRLLAYRYYGETTDADEIGRLNGIVDPSFVEGTVEVFTA